MRTDIETGLFKRVDEMAAQLNPPFLDAIAWPEVVFEKPDNRRFIEVIHLPNTPIDYDWNNDATTYQGVLLLNVYFGTGLGTIVINKLVDQIVENWFQKTTRFSEGGAIIRIETTPEVNRVVSEGDASFIPVQIQYRATKGS